MSLDPAPNAATPADFRRWRRPRPDAAVLLDLGRRTDPPHIGWVWRYMSAGHAQDIHDRRTT